MIKPATIVLSLVGTAIVGGAAISHFEAQDKKDDWGQVADGQSYPNNYYVPGAGYYHAPFHAFFPYQYNFFNSSLGYYYGGSWWPSANVTTVTSSVPTPSAVAGARSAFASSRMSSSSFGAHGSSSSISHGGFGSTGHGEGSAS